MRTVTNPHTINNANCGKTLTAVTQKLTFLVTFCLTNTRKRTKKPCQNKSYLSLTNSQN